MLYALSTNITPMIFINITYIVAGLVLLYFGAELLVDNSVKVAKKFNLSSFLIGSVIVGFGTSMPELSVSLTASLAGDNDLSLANIIGSNGANISFILATVGLFYPIPIKRKFLINDMIPLVGVYIFLFFTLVNFQNLFNLSWLSNINLLFEGATINAVEGFLMIAIMGIYLRSLYGRSQDDIDQSTPSDVKSGNMLKYLLLIFAGLGMLIIGSKWLIIGSKTIAVEVFGISERIIGLTVVAVGTSLPELSSSFVASMRKEYDLSLGNIIGSNLFNILVILGATSIVVNIGPVEAVFIKDYIVMFVVLLALMGFGFFFKAMTRLGAALFITSFCVYTYYIIQYT